VIASAVIPTVIANAFYLPHHLLPKIEPNAQATRDAEPVPPRQLSAAQE
jgi:glutathione-regulated potassium-efflux system ancillary protein KefC